MMAPPAQTTPPPPPPSQQLFSASTDATQPLPEAAPSVSTSSRRRQLSIADGKRLLEQYRRLKAQALAGPRVLAQLEDKCRALEDAMADVVLESDDRREEAEALSALQPGERGRGRTGFADRHEASTRARFQGWLAVGHEAIRAPRSRKVLHWIDRTGRCPSRKGGRADRSSWRARGEGGGDGLRGV